VFQYCVPVHADKNKTAVVSKSLSLQSNASHLRYISHP